MDQPEKRARLLRTDPALLGSRIKSARIAAGLTQGAVAEGHLSVGYLSRIESGKRRPDPALLDAIAARLSVSLDHLFADSETVADVEDPTLDFIEIAVGLGDAESALVQLAQIDRSRLSSADAWRAELVHARALEATGDLNGAVAVLEVLQERAGERHQRLKLGIALTRCYRELGEFPNAIHAGEAELARLREIGLVECDESVQLTVSVAASYFEQGDRERAVRMCRRAITAAEGLGSPTARASAYWNASVFSMEQGLASDAAALAKRALALLSEGSDERNLSRLRAQVGLMELRLDAPEVTEARAHLLSAQADMRTSHAGLTEILWTRLGIARCDLLEGALVEAEEQTDQLIVESRGVSPVLEADVLLLAAQVALGLGELPRARTHLMQAVHRLLAAGNDRAAADRWMDLATLLDSVGESEAAKDAYRAAAVASGLRPRLATSTSTAPLDASALVSD